MAQKIVTLLTDDVDGGDADETVIFGLDGKTYEIDLKQKNADKLRKILEPYVQAGRKQPKKGDARGQKRAAASGEDTAKVRAWAKEQGYEVNDRGRVPASIREAYEKAS